jgi:hypothetical protein
MSLVHLIAASLSFTLVSHSAFADSTRVREVCEQSGYFGAEEIAKQNAEMIPFIEKREWSALPASVSQYCRQNPGEYSFCSNQLGVLVWALHMIPEADAGRAAYRIQTEEIGPHYAQYFEKQYEKTGKTLAGASHTTTEAFSFDAVLEKAAAEPLQAYTPEEIAYTKARLKLLVETGDWAADKMHELKRRAPALCSVYGGALSARDCTDGLRRVADLMHPRSLGSYAYSMIPLYEEFLTDARYARALPRLALKIRERIRRADNRESAAGGSFLADAIQSFSEVGLSRRESIEFAWKWMAVYSTRGSSFQNFYDFLHERQLGFGMAILAASSGASTLDQIRYGDAHSPTRSYTLPSTMRTSCYYGKPYHFWMSAYFTRLLRAEGYAPRASALASYITGTLYEFGSDTRGRDPRRGVTSAVDSPYGRWIKTNLFFNAMGARYGRDIADASLERKPGVETDRLLERFLDHSLPTEVLPDRVENPMVENQPGRFALFTAKYQPFPLLFSFLRLRARN